MTDRPANESSASTARLADLSRLLWDQRSLVEMLEFRLEVQQLLTIAGKVDRLPLAIDDVESVLDRIRMSEDVRLGVVAECSVELGLGVGASLRELAAVAPDPWGHIFEDHQTALLRLVAASEDLATSNRQLAAKGIGEARNALGHLGGAPVTAYGRHGDRPSLALPPTLVDRTA